MVKFINYKSF